jgi:branched-chain amino acid transport system substrate-binding protein
VRARWPGLAALAVAAIVGGGCAGGGAATSDDATGGVLAVYSSLPLQGPSGPISEQIVGGEKLALAQAGGRAGRFRVGFDSLDDSNPTTGRWSPGETASDAKTAADDTSTIAYLGDYESAATAISLPLMNSAGIAQVSPASPYIGLTSSLDAGQDEPERFYLTGRRNFLRLAPSDQVQAQAEVAVLRALGIHQLYVLDDTEDAFSVPLAELVASDAEADGIHVVAHEGVALVTGGSYKGEAEKIGGSGAEAVFYSGTGSGGAATLFNQLHAASPQLKLLASSSAMLDTFTSELGAAGPSTYIPTPIVPTTMYPPAGRRVLQEYGRVFHTPGTGYALVGYEAMNLVLAAIRAAGAHGNDRRVVAQLLLKARTRNAVLGPYSIEASGETTLARFAVDRVGRFGPTFWRAFDVPR